MNKEQKKILEERIKSLKTNKISATFLILAGIAFNLTIVGMIIGIPLVLGGWFFLRSCKKEIADIEFKLAGNN